MSQYDVHCTLYWGIDALYNVQCIRQLVPNFLKLHNSKSCAVWVGVPTINCTLYSAGSVVILVRYIILISGKGILVKLMVKSTRKGGSFWRETEQPHRGAAKSANNGSTTFKRRSLVFRKRTTNFT